MNTIEATTPTPTMTNNDYLKRQLEKVARERAQAVESEELSKIVNELESLSPEERNKRVLTALTEILLMTQSTKSYSNEPFILVRAFEEILKKETQGTNC